MKIYTRNREKKEQKSGLWVFSPIYNYSTHLDHTTLESKTEIQTALFFPRLLLPLLVHSLLLLRRLHQCRRRALGFVAMPEVLQLERGLPKRRRCVGPEHVPHFSDPSHQSVELLHLFFLVVFFTSRRRPCGCS
ncbi:unnamed protein product [Musa acuminata subsp. burmannicoides]